MRLFESVTAGDAALVGPAANTVTVNGPTYQFTAQTQILRFLFAHAHLLAKTMDGVIAVVDAFLQITLNPNSGGDKVIRCPNKWTLVGAANGQEPLQGIGAGSWLQTAGVFQTFSFDMRNADIRGDDIPNYGGIQFVPPAGSAFSVRADFIFSIVYNPIIGGTVITPAFDILADLTDYAAISNFRR